MQHGSAVLGRGLRPEIAICRFVAHSNYYYGLNGIVNDANRYAIETVGDPAYPLLLFQRMITGSLDTMKIVRNLPNLDI